MSDQRLIWLHYGQTSVQQSFTRSYNKPKIASSSPKSSQQIALLTASTHYGPSSQAPVVAPKGASVATHGPWERIPEMSSSRKDTMKQAQGKKNKMASQFFLICSQVQDRNVFANRGANWGAPTCDWAELWTPACCFWMRDISP